MKKLIIIFTGICLAGELVCQDGPPIKSDAKSVDSWYELVKGRSPSIPSDAIIPYDTFTRLLEVHINNQKKLLIRLPWLGEKIDPENVNLTNDFQDKLYQPFALKLAIPSGGSGYFWGDLHGDVQALAVCLKMLKDQNIIDDTFKVVQPNTYFFFLGDMVDRGQHQFDMLSLILSFAIQNPGKVFLIRGNHESLGQSDSYDFNVQLNTLYQKQHPGQEFTKDNPIYKSIALFYNLMPDVAFVGCNNNYLQCCHGGIEIRYNPKDLLAQPGNLQYQLIKKTDKNTTLLNMIIDDKSIREGLNIDQTAYKFFLYNRSTAPSPFFKSSLGFLWADFNNDPSNNYNTYFNPQRGLYAGKDFTHEVLKYYSSDTIRVRGIMRAHQHNVTLPGIAAPENGGIYSMWDNTVITNLSTSQFTGVIAFNKIIFNDQYSLWLLSNFSWHGNSFVYQKTWFLEKWVNNAFNPPSIAERNADLHQKVYDEMDKGFPNYEQMQKWLTGMQPDPSGNNVDYDAAQKELISLHTFLNALSVFNKKEYDSAVMAFKKLLGEPFVKFKAREYYARAAIEGLIEDEYEDALEHLNETADDSSVEQYDQRMALELAWLLKNLIDARSQEMEF